MKLTRRNFLTWAGLSAVGAVACEGFGIRKGEFSLQSPVDLPEDLVAKLFKSRVQRMIKKGNWPKDKPLPDLEQFIARKLLTETLREMGYYLQTPPKS